MFTLIRHIFLSLFIISSIIGYCYGDIISHRVLRFSLKPSDAGFKTANSNGPTWEYTSDGRIFNTVSSNYFGKLSINSTSPCHSLVAGRFFNVSSDNEQTCMPSQSDLSKLVKTLVKGDYNKSKYEDMDQLFAEIGAFHPLLRNAEVLSCMFTNPDYLQSDIASVVLVDIRVCLLKRSTARIFVTIGMDTVYELLFSDFSDSDERSKSSDSNCRTCTLAATYNRMSYRDLKTTCPDCVSKSNKIYEEYCKGMAPVDILQPEYEAVEGYATFFSKGYLYDIQNRFNQRPDIDESLKNAIVTVRESGENGWVHSYEAISVIGVQQSILATWQYYEYDHRYNHVHMDDLMIEVGKLANLTNILPVSCNLILGSNIGVLTLYTPVFQEHCFAEPKNKMVTKLNNDVIKENYMQYDKQQTLTPLIGPAFDSVSRLITVTTDDLQSVRTPLALLRTDVEDTVIFCLLFNGADLDNSIRIYYSSQLDIFRIQLKRFENFWTTKNQRIRDSFLWSHPSIYEPIVDPFRIIRLLKTMPVRSIRDTLINKLDSLASKQIDRIALPQLFPTVVKILITIIEAHIRTNEVFNLADVVRSFDDTMDEWDVIKSDGKYHQCAAHAYTPPTE